MYKLTKGDKCKQLKRQLLYSTLKSFIAQQCSCSFFTDVRQEEEHFVWKENLNEHLWKLNKSSLIKSTLRMHRKFNLSIMQLNRFNQYNWTLPRCFVLFVIFAWCSVPPDKILNWLTYPRRIKIIQLRTIRIFKNHKTTFTQLLGKGRKKRISKGYKSGKAKIHRAHPLKWIRSRLQSNSRQWPSILLVHRTAGVGFRFL